MRIAPQHTRFWFILTLTVKLILFAIFLNLGKSFSSGEYSELGVLISKDYGELLGPADSFIENGTYSLREQSDQPYAGRLPGYSVPYMLLRSVLPQGLALLLLILGQIALSAFAAVRISQLIFRISEKKWLFYAALLGVSVLSYSLPWEGWTYPESFGLSAWLLGVYYFQQALDLRSGKAFLWSGFFVAWAFFLRGFLGVYFLAFALVFGAMWLRRHQARGSIFKFALLFILPLFIMESAWTIRNKLSLGEWVFLQTSFGWSDVEQEYALDKVYKPSMLELRKLIASWGGDNVHFYPESDMSYFYMKDEPDSFFPFPNDIFDDSFTPDSLRYIRTLVQSSFNKELPIETRIKADQELASKAEDFRQRFRKKHAGYAYLKAPLLRLKNLVVRNVTSNWPGPAFSASPIWYKAYKLIVLAMYFISMIIGALSTLYLVFMKRSEASFHLLWISTALLALTFMFLINTAEFKYFMTASVNLFLLSLIGLGEFLSLRSRKSTN